MRRLITKMAAAALLSGFLNPVDTAGQDVVNPITLSPTVHVESAVRSAQKGDTLVFNAAAYQVVQGADSESLISKMPGISVGDNGVEANGKTVARILLDDQEFFGDDVMSALKSVPADMIKQIEVINRLSDNAQLTGVDDGNSYTAINIVTKRKKGTGMTAGRLYGSYGISDKKTDEGKLRHNYMAGGNISHFADKGNFSLIGMSNNISKFNFTNSDIVSGASGLDASSGRSFRVNPMSGISTVHSLGANYSDKKMNFSYFFNDIANENYPISDKLTMTSIENRKLLTHSENDYQAHNMTHKITGKVTVSPAKRHSIIIRPYVTFQDLANYRNLYTTYTYTYTDAADKFIRNQLNINDNDRWSIRAGSSFSYRYRFQKKRRSLSASARYNYYRYSGLDRSWQWRFREQETDYDPETAYYTYIQDKTRLTNQHNAGASLTYTEPVSKRSLMSATYEYSMNDTEGENLVYRFDNKTEEYATEADTRLSGVSRSIFQHHRAGVRYNYGFKKISVTATARYQCTVFDGKVRMPMEGYTEKTYHHALYNVTANLPFNKQNTLRLSAKGYTSNPSNNSLQNIVDRSNTSAVRAGNPNLTPAYMHEAELRYIHTGKKGGATFSFTATYTGSANYFCDSLVINNPKFEVMEGVELGEGNQFTKPINLSGYNKVVVKTSFGFPIKWIRCNFNVNAIAQIRQIPGMTNGERVPVNRNYFQLGGRLDSNISTKLDFTVSYFARYNMNEYSGKYGKVENNFLTHRVSAKIKWIFGPGFTFTGAAQYRQYKSTQGLYDDKMVLCDLFIGKRFLKSGCLEMNAGVNDLFNDNIKQYWHSIGASGKTDGINLGIGRYFSIQCIWHIRYGSK